MDDKDEELEGEDGNILEENVKVTSLADVPLDVLCYMIFCDFSVYWITNNIIYVCKQFYTSGWRAIVNREVSLSECCWEDYKIPSAPLAYKLLSYNVIKRKDKELMRMSCSQGYSDIVRELLVLMKPTGEWLKSAVARNHIEIVELIISDSRYRLERDYDCLETAVVNSNEEIALLLLKSGRVSPHYKNSLEFVRSCENGLTKVVKHLLSDPFTNPAVNNNEPIRVASENGHTDIVFELIRKQSEQIQNSQRKHLLPITSTKPSFNFPLVDPTVDDNICIRKASSNGHIGVVEVLIFSDNVDPTSNDQECIRNAASNGHYETVALLLKDPRVDPSGKDNQAFREAAANGHFEVVKLLIEDERVDAQEFEDSAFRYACRNGHLDIVKYLLTTQKESIDVNIRDGYALNNACQFGRKEVVKYLLSLPSLNGTVISKAFRIACYIGHYNIVRMLLRDERMKSLGDNNNEALCNAIRGCHVEIVKLLMNDERVNTAEGHCMDACVKVGDLKTTKALMEHPNFKLNNPHDRIAKYLILANSRNFYEVSRYLFKHKDLKTSLLSTNEGWLFHAEKLKEYDENEELTPLTPLEVEDEEEYLSQEFDRATDLKEQMGGKEVYSSGMERGVVFADSIFQMIQKGGI